MAQMTRFVCGALLALAAGAATCNAQTYFKGGSYTTIPGAGGMRYNNATGAYHIPGQAVIKSSGTYNYIGRGYYQNPVTGNVYNPYDRSYTHGSNVQFRGGSYSTIPGAGGMRYNNATGAYHIPGQAVIKPSGTYNYIGRGYYQNPVTGNVYNPYTRVYKSR